LLVTEELSLDASMNAASNWHVLATLLISCSDGTDKCTISGMNSFTRLGTHVLTKACICRGANVYLAWNAWHKCMDKCTNLYGLAICTNLPWGLNGDHTVSWASEVTRVSTSSILAGPGKLAKKGLVVTAFINVFTCKIGSQSANCTQKKTSKSTDSETDSDTAWLGQSVTVEVKLAVK